MAIDSAPVIPYYFQIKQDILRRIRSQEIREGEKIPSETEIASTYRVSRPTVRRAIDELVFAGYLYRHQGKGTFVSPQRFVEDLTDYVPFAETARASGRNPHVKVLSKEIQVATEQMCRDLQLRPGAKLIEVVGVRYADEEPIAIRTSYYPELLMPDLVDRLTGDRVLSEVVREYGLEPHRARHTLQVVRARKEDALTLAVSVGDPLILWEGVVFDTAGAPFELSRALYRADKYQFYIEHQRKVIVNSGVQMKPDSS